MGQEVVFRYPPERIVSLVPSQTEFLLDLGLEGQIVGLTKFCVHPKEKVKEKPKVGGTKKFRMETIDELQPDLIIGNKEENYKEGIVDLQRKFPVWMSDIVTLADAYQMMSALGDITGKSLAAAGIINQIKKGFASLNFKADKKALYFIWQKPYMLAAGDTFINNMLALAGFKNLLATETRYPALSEEELKAFHPDFILLSSEPYPFKEKHFATFKNIFPSAKIILVDGEMFSWFGSRLLHAPVYFKNLGKKVMSYEL